MFKNKEIAVSLRWDGDGAPKVTAKGRGEVAANIIAVAKEHKIPIREEPELVAMLATLELNQEIPEALYAAVAEIIAFAYRLTNKPLRKLDT